MLMSVGDIRSPVRPLTTGSLSKIYPGELLIDPSTGNFRYYDSNNHVIQHNKPGSLTVIYGTQTILDGADLSGNVSVTVPEYSHPTHTAHTTSALYKITVDALGHVDSATAVQFDDEPTEDSTNLMTSGAIYVMEKYLLDLIAALSITVNDHTLVIKTPEETNIEGGM